MSLWASPNRYKHPQDGGDLVNIW